MRAWQSAAAAAAMVLAFQAPAQADIEVENQASVPVYVEFSTYAEPGSVAMAVMCGSVGVASGGKAIVPKPAVCTDKATLRATGPRRPTGAPAECRTEGVAWSDGRMVVTGTLHSLVCAQ